MSVRVTPLPPDEWNDDVISALSTMVTPERIQRREAGTAHATSLSEHLDEHQRMDLVFTIGSRGLPAMAFNTFGVQIDHDNEQQER